MPLKIASFFFTKNPGVEDKRGINLHARSAYLYNGQSEFHPEIANKVMTFIFIKMKEANQAMYEDALDLPSFTATLVQKNESSEGMALEIQGKALGKVFKFDLQNLKPETSDGLINSFREFPLEMPFLTQADTISSAEAPKKRSILEILLMPFTLIASFFKSFFTPSVVEEKNDSSAEKAPPLLPIAEETGQLLEMASQLLPSFTAAIERQVPVPVEKAPVVLQADDSIFRAGKNSTVHEYVDCDEVVGPLSDDSARIKKKHEFVDFDEMVWPEHLASSSKGDQPAGVEAPVAKPRQADLSKDDADDFVEIKRPTTPSLPDVDPFIPVPRSPEEEMLETLKSLFSVHFATTSVKRSPKTESEWFGNYFMDRLLGKPESCYFNFETGEFTLTFAKEQKIPITKLPAGKSKEVNNTLKLALGTTLHIAKEMKGKIDFNEHKPYFNEGALTLQWTTLFKTFKAHLIGLSTQDSRNLIFTGKGSLLGVEKTAQSILAAQDFVDLLECNLSRN